MGTVGYWRIEANLNNGCCRLWNDSTQRDNQKSADNRANCRDGSLGLLALQREVTARALQASQSGCGGGQAVEC